MGFTMRATNVRDQWTVLVAADVSASCAGAVAFYATYATTDRCVVDVMTDIIMMSILATMENATAQRIPTWTTGGRHSHR